MAVEMRFERRIGLEAGRMNIKKKVGAGIADPSKAPYLPRRIVVGGIGGGGSLTDESHAPLSH